MEDPLDLFGPEDDESPGWTALEVVLAARYPGQEPLSFGPIIQYEQGGPDPLEGLVVYRCERPRPYWHYVSFGFSELHEKVSPDPELSGFGFELSLRLLRDPDQDSPPSWPLDLLQSLARYVFTTGNAFDENHHMDLDGPLMPNLETALCAIVLRADPELPAPRTPHGLVKFLQVVALTADELEVVRAWDPARFLALLAHENPLLLIDLRRGSLLEASGLEEEINRLIEEEGSTQEAAFMSSLRWSVASGDLTIQLEEGAARNLSRLLAGRTLHGRSFLLVQGEEQTVEVNPGPCWAFAVDPHEPLVRLEVPPALAEAMIADLSRSGDHHWPHAPGFVLRVEPAPGPETA